MQIQTVFGNVVELKPGEPTEFTATRGFQLPAPPGGIAPNIPQGGTMTFDGQNFSFAGDIPKPLPQFLGAIKAEWVIPSAQYTGQVGRPVSAGITVRNAEGGSPMDVQKKQVVLTAQAEEREVGNISQHAAQVRQGNQENYRRASYNGPGTQVVQAEDQEGIPVRHLGNPDGRKNPVDMTRASEAIRAAESVRVQPGVGRSREEIMAAMTPEQRADYENQLQVRKAMHGQLDTQVALPDQGQGRVVANLQTSNGVQTKEGIKTTVSTGGGTETFDAGGTGGPAEISTVIVEGVKMTNTNGPKKGQVVETAKTKADLTEDPRRVIAKSICADFPANYDFDASPRKKIARLQADYEDRPDVIRAVASAETDQEVRSRLIEEFSEAFGG